MPNCKIEGNKYAALAQQIAGVDRSILGEEIVNFTKYRSAFVDAID